MSQQDFNLIDIKQLNLSFGRKTVISDFSLKINAGERIAIVGESGSGQNLDWFIDHGTFA